LGEGSLHRALAPNWAKAFQPPRGVAPMFVNNTLVVAADRDIAPMTAAECEGRARTISRPVSIPLRTSVGHPDLPDVCGKACLMSGSATGLKATFAEAQKRLEAVFSDWTPEPDFDTGGADSAQEGFSKGAKRLVYELTNDPPHGTCGDVVLAALTGSLRVDSPRVGERPLCAH
jgi:hypothetical protein